MIISTSAPKVKKSMDVEYNLGANLDEAVKLFGAEVVHGKFVDAEIVTIQGLVRTGLEKGTDEATIKSRVAAHKPGVRARGIADPQAARKNMIAEFAKMSPAEQLAEMKKMQAEAEEVRKQLVGK